MTFFSLDGPETGGDQMRGGGACMGLLLKVEYASGARCTQRIASASSIGIMGGEAVYVEGRAVCFQPKAEALEVRRDGALVARVAELRRIERVPSFPSRCVATTIGRRSR